MAFWPLNSGSASQRKVGKELPEKRGRVVELLCNSVVVSRSRASHASSICEEDTSTGMDGVSVKECQRIVPLLRLYATAECWKKTDIFTVQSTLVYQDVSLRHFICEAIGPGHVTRPCSSQYPLLVEVYQYRINSRA